MPVNVHTVTDVVNLSEVFKLHDSYN